MFVIQAGELRTKIRIQKQIATGSGTKKVISWPDLGNTSEADPPRYIYAKWASLKGIEKWMADTVQALDTASVTIRYNAAVTAACRVICDGINYQIVDISDPTQHKQWLQITVKAAVNG
jgi:SPP1 family predicted phage head-tail adaptor